MIKSMKIPQGVNIHLRSLVFPNVTEITMHKAKFTDGNIVCFMHNDIEIAHLFQEHARGNLMVSPTRNGPNRRLAKQIAKEFFPNVKVEQP